MNPILPLTEYVPDGEPHVFGSRVYLYGSHDKANSDRFCVQDYTVWSAPVHDLSDWKCHGVTYRKDQDPRSKPGKLVDYYAPDCVRGNDGRYYLYYCAMGPNTKNFGPMSVAVSDDPGGPFEYLGDIQYPDGTPVLKYLTNDPAVLHDDGRIWLYYGWGLARDFRSRVFAPIYNWVQSKLFGRSISEIKATKPSILSCAVVELEADMMTVKAAPKAVLDSKTTAPKNSALYHHAFYEAPSIRKIGDTYYLVYSSGENNELAYATSRYPDRDFVYRGVIISNSDLGYKGNTVPKAPAGTIHGGIENIMARDITTLPAGRTRIDSEKAVVTVSTVTPQSSDKALFQRHDAHIVLETDLEGSELFEVSLAELTPTKPTDEAADTTVGTAGTSIAGMLCEGRFALYLAGEPYKSGLKAQGCGKLKKAVFTIELDPDEEETEE